MFDNFINRVPLDNEVKRNKVAKNVGGLFLFGVPNGPASCSNILPISLLNKDANILIHRSVPAHNSSQSNITILSSYLIFDKFKFRI